MPKVPKRTGKPLTVYFNDEQTKRLNNIARERHVAKADLLRLAVELLFEQMESGHLQVRVGVQLLKTQN